MRHLPAPPKQEQAAHSTTVLGSVWGLAARFSQTSVRSYLSGTREERQRTLNIVSCCSYLFRYARDQPAIYRQL